MLAGNENRWVYALVALAFFGAWFVTAAKAEVIEEIIVTAEFREKAASDTPISITAFDSHRLQKFRMERSVDVAAQTPNLEMGRVFGLAAPRVNIRGVTNADYSPTSNTPVTVYSDGSVLNNTTVHGFAMFDLERVEVLRGPQGTLYGRNATTGSINFISARPTQEFSGYARGTIGRFGERRLDGAISGPLGERLSGRLAVTKGVGDGWVKNEVDGKDGPEQDDEAFRAVLEFVPTDEINIFLKAQYADYSGETVTNHSLARINPIFGSENPGPDSDFRRIRLDLTDRPEDITSTDIVLQVDWDLGSVTLTSLTGYNDHDRNDFNDDDSSEFVSLHQNFRHESDQFSQEFRLASNGTGAWSWITGIYYLVEDVEAQTRFDFTDLFFDPNPLNGYGSGRDGDQELTSYAAFFQVEYDFNKAWTGAIGLRYTDDEKEIDYLGRNCIGFPRLNDRSFVDWSAITLDCGETGAIVDSDSWSAVSGSASLQYRPNNNTLYYGNISNGFKGGGYNINTSTPSTVSSVDPESLWSYEVGFKWEAEDRSAVVSGSFFYYDYEDLQQFSLVDLGGGTGVPNFASILSNVDSAKVYGGEIEALIAPAEALLINLGVGWAKSEYTDFPQDDGTDFDGNEFPTAPELSVNGLIQYTFNLSDTWTLTPQFDWTYTDEFFVDVANRDSVEVNGRQVSLKPDSDWDLNFRLTFESLSLGLSVTAFIEEIGTDEGDQVFHFESFPSLGTSASVFEQPETYGVTVQYNFN